MRFLLDTSFIIRALELGIGPVDLIKQECPSAEVYTTSDVVEELKKIKKPLFKVALKILERDNVEIFLTNLGSADNSCIYAAKKLGAVLCSEDVKLRKRARKEGISTASIRKGKLEINRVVR